MSPARPPFLIARRRQVRRLLCSCSSFLGSGRHVSGRFLDDSGRVFRHVLASSKHQFDGFHLHFFRDFSKGSHVFGSHFSSGRSKGADGFRIVGRLGFGFRNVASLGQSVLGPFSRDLGRLFSGFQSNFRELLGESSLGLERVLESAVFTHRDMGVSTVVMNGFKMFGAD